MQKRNTLKYDARPGETIAADADDSKAVALLDWYDRHRRMLPWRAAHGVKPDPYAVWLSEIMLQQTTVAAVKPYFERFLLIWPTIGALAAAPVEEVMKAWAGLGYYSRARNLHLCALRIAHDHGGTFPRLEADLLALPGVGTYTAAAIAAIAFDQRAAVVDGNVERVISRYFAIETPLPQAKAEIRQLTAAIGSGERPGDFAQAMMDLGATICTSRKPACVLCPWSGGCKSRINGVQDRYPRKAAKIPRPDRAGAAFVVLDPKGAVLVRRRPPKGLLGGMLEVPSSDWMQKDTAAHYRTSEALAYAPLDLPWRAAGPIKHVFTHFSLQLDVYVAHADRRMKAPAGMRWAEAEDLAGEAFPNLFRKVLSAAIG